MSPNNKFKQIRLDKNLKQSEFGKILGLKDYQVKDIESGKQKVSIELSLLIEDIFSINMRWLLTDRGEKYLINNLNFKNNEILTINLNNYSDEKKTEDIIKLLEYASKPYLEAIQEDLENMKNIVENRKNGIKR